LSHGLHMQNSPGSVPAELAILRCQTHAWISGIAAFTWPKGPVLSVRYTFLFVAYVIYYNLYFRLFMAYVNNYFAICKNTSQRSIRLGGSLCCIHSIKKALRIPISSRTHKAQYYGIMVSEEGLEPSRLSAYAPQTYVSARSTTPTGCGYHQGLVALPMRIIQQP
jgi:hypothetical protein